MVASDVVLLVEDVSERESKNGKKFYSGKFSSGLPFDYPTFLLCNKIVENGFYKCSIRISFDRDRNTNNISVHIGEAVAHGSISD